MTAPTLDDLAADWLNAKARADAAYRRLLDRVAAEAEQDDANILALAARARISRTTIYNELGRRQERRDGLSGNGAPVPAPADADR